jgi:hypothetical protein
LCVSEALTKPKDLDVVKVALANKGAAGGKDAVLSPKAGMYGICVGILGFSCVGVVDKNTHVFVCPVSVQSMSSRNSLLDCVIRVTVARV